MICPISLFQDKLFLISLLIAVIFSTSCQKSSVSQSTNDKPSPDTVASELKSFVQKKAEASEMVKDSPPIETVDAEAYQQMSPIRRQWRRKVTQPLTWKHLVQGLDYAYAEAPINCNIGDGHIDVLRIDSAYFVAELYLSLIHISEPTRPY